MRGAILGAVFTSLIFLHGVWPGHSQTPQNVQFEAAITVADGRLKTGDNADAFAQAEKAISISPDRFEGHYFAGVALLRQKHPDRALPYFRDALRRAPETERAKIQLEIYKAETTDRANTKIQEARTAEADGNYFSAANAYTDAVDLVHTEVAAGQSAVRLWLLLREPAKAARQLRWLATSEDAVIRDDATRQLNGMADQLAQIAKDSTSRGWSLTDQALSAQDSRLEAAADNFLRAIDAAPTTGGADSAHAGLIVTRARQNDKDKLLAAFKVAAFYSIVPDTSYFDRAGVASCAVGCRRDQALAPFLCASEVQVSLQAIYGPSVVQSTRTFCTAYADRQRDLAARLAQQEEQRRKAEAEQLARETEKNARDFATLGWTLADQASRDPRDPKWESAAKAFLASVAALPRVGGIDSPHMGLIVARAAQQQKDGVLAAFRTAAASGMVPDSPLYYDRTGQSCSHGCDRDTYLGPYLCVPDGQNALEAIYGPAGPRIAREFCANRDRRLHELEQARERQRQAAEQGRRLQEGKAKMLTDFSALVMTQPNACFSGQNQGLTECLCVTNFDEAHSTLKYKIRITGTFTRHFENHDWADYKHDVTGTLQGRVSVPDSLTQVVIAQTGVISATGSIDVRYNFGPGDPRTGTEAFTSGTTVLGATLWSVILPEGRVMFSGGATAFPATRIPNGCGF